MNHFYGLNKEKKTTPSWIQKVCVCGGNYIRYIQPFRPVCLGFPEREMKIFHPIFHLKKKKTTKNLKQYCWHWWWCTLPTMNRYIWPEGIIIPNVRRKQKNKNPIHLIRFFFHFISYGHIHPNQMYIYYICV